MRLPIIVGMGGFNAAGRSSGFQSYKRMILESLNDADKAATITSLANMMGLASDDVDAVLSGTLVRKIESDFFDVEHVHTAKKTQLDASESSPIVFEISSRAMNFNVPENWKVEPIDDEGRRFRVEISTPVDIAMPVTESNPVKAAGQLPSGFDPSSLYRSQHHPRGLQLSVLAASDAILSMGIDWQDILDRVEPDEVAVYSSSVMSQLDDSGFGGMLNARGKGGRVTSKQLALGLNTMPADFINAYVLGSVGATGGVTGACATFLYNLDKGVEDIKCGRRRVVLVGSAEAPVIPEVIDGYSAMSALATDAEIAALDGAHEPDHRRASRPFGKNCGFTIAESAQFTVLMDDALALELGAKILGAVPNVFVNADGYKKSISSPGAGNYITMAKAVGFVTSWLGSDVVKDSSFIQAHGSSTPQNRLTESKIFDQVACAFDITDWPVAAVKSYVGHSLGPASGDQLAATLGVFEYGIIPGIKTINEVAADVYDDRLTLSITDLDIGQDKTQVAFLNSKGFGGNNATAVVVAPSVVHQFLQDKYTQSDLSQFETRQVATEASYKKYVAQADSGEYQAIYQFGTNVIDDMDISISDTRIHIPGFKQDIVLNDLDGFTSLAK